MSCFRFLRSPRVLVMGNSSPLFPDADSEHPSDIVEPGPTDFSVDPVAALGCTPQNIALLARRSEPKRTGIELVYIPVQAEQVPLQQLLDVPLHLVWGVSNDWPATVSLAKRSQVVKVTQPKPIQRLQADYAGASELRGMDPSHSTDLPLPPVSGKANLCDPPFVGIVDVIEKWHLDPTDPSGKFGMVTVRAVTSVTAPVTLAQIKAEPRLADFALVRQSRLSVVPVTDEEWALLLSMAQTSL